MRHEPNVQLEKHRQGGEPGKNVGWYVIKTKSIDLRVLVSVDGGWDHVSVSTATRTPTWDEMTAVKQLFFRDDETVLQFHPRKDQYANYHPHTLHLWREQAVEAALPPAVLVAIPEGGGGWQPIPEVRVLSEPEKTELGKCVAGEVVTFPDLHGRIAIIARIDNDGACLTVNGPEEESAKYPLNTVCRLLKITYREPESMRALGWSIEQFVQAAWSVGEQVFKAKADSLEAALNSVDQYLLEDFGIYLTSHPVEVMHAACVLSAAAAAQGAPAAVCASFGLRVLTTMRQGGYVRSAG